MTRRKNTTLVATLLGGAMFALLCIGIVHPVLDRRGSRIIRTRIGFEGQATGGTLVIGYIYSPHNVNHDIVSIHTQRGESPKSVVDRLAHAIAYTTNGMIKGASQEHRDSERKRMVSDNAISLHGTIHDYLLAGSEGGLGIPSAPLSLSCSFKERDRAIEVQWINPQGENSYDRVYIGWQYKDKDRITREIDTHPLPCKYFIQLPAEQYLADVDIWINGIRNIPMKEHEKLWKAGVPSNVAAMHLTNGGSCQDEILAIPFTAGIAPNWQAWGTAGSREKTTAFEQGTRYKELLTNSPFRTFLTMPFYQIIKSPESEAIQGVYRKLLGLTPGHTYRLTACVSTLEMDTIKKKWSFTIHAAPTKGMLTAQQMAGHESLPYPGPVSKDWMMAYYDPNHTTKGFEFAATDYTKIHKDHLDLAVDLPMDVQEVTVPNVPLPGGVDEITIWTRFQCDDPTGKVALSGVRLEDITSADHVLSPKQMIELEFQKERDFLKKEAELVQIEERYHKK